MTDQSSGACESPANVSGSFGSFENVNPKSSLCAHMYLPSFKSVSCFLILPGKTTSQRIAATRCHGDEKGHNQPPHGTFPQDLHSATR